MNIVWLNWKDTSHPQAGGAELVTEQLAKRLAKDGHTVTLLVSSFRNAKPKEKREGYTIIRVGNRLTVYWQAYRYYKHHFRGKTDLVIDEINTMPFFAKFYAKAPVILFIHQLCREIWFYQFPLPFSLIGYVLEPIYLRLLANLPVITVSRSTKTDLEHHKFPAPNIHIIRQGIEETPLENLTDAKKFPAPTLIAVGQIRAMKRTVDIIKAFTIAKQTIPNLTLIIAGDYEGSYGRKVVAAIAKSPYKSNIFLFGKISQSKKKNLFQKAHVLCVAAVKEGWGLTVTEAASQGTPAVVYNAHGLRDSVQNNKTGLVCNQNTPQAMAQAIISLLTNRKKYDKLRTQAWQASQHQTFDNAYTDFKRVITAV